MESAAHTCIPKMKVNNERRRHDIPRWREVMTSFKDDVTYWTQIQFLHSNDHLFSSQVPNKHFFHNLNNIYRVCVILKNMHVDHGKSTKMHAALKKDGIMFFIERLMEVLKDTL